MFNVKLKTGIKELFEVDTYAWFNGTLHGHMGKWQYMEPAYKGDPVNGAHLWDKWAREASKGDNMLKRQSHIIDKKIDDMIALTGQCKTLIDLGPGGEEAVINNTVPIVQAYGDVLKKYIPIDINEEFVQGAESVVKSSNENIDCCGLHADFTNTGINICDEGKTVVFFNGGTIGNFEAAPNTPDAVNLMAGRISALKNSMPAGAIMFVGLEATQNVDLLYGDYDNPIHAAYEINMMHAIKRDLLSEEDGFDPYAWKYSMKWYPDAHQFCHIAEATELQRFEMWGQEMRFAKGAQLVIDNSFKFPVLAMQRAAQKAKTKYLKPFSDHDGRMVVHAIQL